MAMEKSDWLAIGKVCLEYIPPMLLALIEVIEADMNKAAAAKEIAAASVKKRNSLMEAVENEPTSD